jgi:CelD/BcsL family acetyltransferase involved in cellulose biosynthesis
VSQSSITEQGAIPSIAHSALASPPLAAMASAASRSHLEVCVYRDVDSLGSLLPAWEDLLSEFPSATVFCTWEWLGSWWRAFGDGQELRVLALFDPAQRLIALAPFASSTRCVAGLSLEVLRLIGDGEDSDNLDLPVRPGYEEAFARRLLDWLEEQAHAWDICELNTLPADSAAGACLKKELQRRGWNTLNGERARSVVSLPNSWESYLNQLSGEDRHNLVRYLRRLGKRYQTRFYKCTQEEELPAALDALFRLHQERWKARGETGTFGSEARRRFYSEMSRLLLERGQLEFWLLELDGKPVAAQFAMRYRDAVFQLQEGFDPKHASDRIGYLLRGHVLKQLIAGGVRRYDFLAGQSLHKSRWGSQVSTYIHIRFARPYAVGALYARYLHHSDQGKEWLRACLPRRAWRLLHWLSDRIGGVRNTGKNVFADHAYYHLRESLFD